MRILLITQLFDPENALKGLSFVREMAGRGHEVEVLTTFPSYPAGRIFPGYRVRWLQKEQHEAVTIFRLPSYITTSRSIVHRLIGYVSFSLAVFIFGLSRPRPDVVYAYYPPIFGGLAAISLAGVKRTRAVYDVQDLWPEALVGAGMTTSQRVLALVERLARFVYRKASGIIVLSDGYARALVEKGVPLEKIKRIYNWCDEARISRLPPRATSSNGADFVIAYAGNIGAAQGLESVVRAAAIVADSGTRRRKIRFKLVGDGVEKSRLESLVANLGLDNVEFTGHVAPEQVGSQVAVADVLLAHLKADPVFAITVPQKTQAYMAMGRPILMAASGESAEIIRNAEAGLIATPCDPHSIADAAIRMSQMDGAELARMGDNGHAYYHRFMSCENGVEQTLQFFDRIASGAAGK